MKLPSIKLLAKELSATSIDNQITEAEIVQMASLCESNAHCIVKDWLIVNLALSASEATHFKAHGVESRFIYAESIIEDSKQRGIEWVRTTLIKRKYSDYMFSTRNTCYILVGQGYRCQMTIENAYRRFGFNS